VEQAHSGIITDIESAKIGDDVYFFTSSFDCSIKAWKINGEGTGLVLYASKPFSVKVFCLSLASPTFLVGACDDGTF